MNDLLVPFLFWLSTLFSLGLSMVGVARERYWLGIIGAILFLPISWYFNGSPSVYGFGLLLPVSQIISAAAVHEKNRLLAWLFLLPSFFVVIWRVIVALAHQVS